MKLLDGCNQLKIMSVSILNLFSKDINVIDEVLARVFSAFFRSKIFVQRKELQR
jgi:hypothetical protein